MADITKTCTKCGHTFPLDSFPKKATSRDGRHSWCQACKLEKDRLYREANREKVAAASRRYRETHPYRAAAASKAWREANRDYGRKHHLQREYGMTPDEFDQMLANQNGACAICGTTDAAGKGWNVDHDHDTGAVRGILCHLCNMSLGSFQDDIELVRAAAAYLEKTSSAAAEGETNSKGATWST